MKILKTTPIRHSFAWWSRIRNKTESVFQLGILLIKVVVSIVVVPVIIIVVIEFKSHCFFHLSMQNT